MRPTSEHGDTSALKRRRIERTDENYLTDDCGSSPSKRLKLGQVLQHCKESVFKGVKGVSNWFSKPKRTFESSYFYRTISESLSPVRLTNIVGYFSPGKQTSSSRLGASQTTSQPVNQLFQPVGGTADNPLFEMSRQSHPWYIPTSGNGRPSAPPPSQQFVQSGSDVSSIQNVTNTTLANVPQVQYQRWPASPKKPLAPAQENGAESSSAYWQTSSILGSRCGSSTFNYTGRPLDGSDFLKGKQEKKRSSVLDKLMSTKTYNKSNQSKYTRNQSYERRKLYGNMSVKTNIRMEDRNNYQLLIQQYTDAALSKPSLNKSAAKRSPFRAPSSPRVQPFSRPSPGQWRAPFQSDTREKTPVIKQRMTPTKSLRQPRHKELFGKTDKDKSPDVENLKMSTPVLKSDTRKASYDSDVIILSDDDDDDVKLTETRDKSRADRSSTDSDGTRTQSPTYEILQKTITSSPYASVDWLEGLKNVTKTGARNNRIKELEIEAKVYEEKRHEKLISLEDQIRDRMKIEEVMIIPESESEEEEEDEVPYLSDDMEEEIDQALRPTPPDEALSCAFNMTIQRRDMSTLSGLNWLNDEIINFYMNLLIKRGEEEGYPSIHAFNTFFYPKLLSGGQNGLKRWTKKIDLFSKDYIVIPVHLGVHWCLCLVDFKEKVVKYYDSMGGNNNKCLAAVLKYLQDESLDKKKVPFDITGWKKVNVKSIPQQMNGSDCGVFTCKFADYLTREKEITFTQDHMHHFRRQMVYEILHKKLL